LLSRQFISLGNSAPVASSSAADAPAIDEFAKLRPAVEPAAMSGVEGERWASVSVSHAPWIVSYQSSPAQALRTQLIIAAADCYSS
jgi:hypothetical protein